MAFQALIKIVSSLIPTGLVIPVLSGPLKGKKWVAGAAAGQGKGLSVVLNRAEPEQLALALKFVKEDGIVFDIGANVGLYSLLLAEKAKKVFSFEPFPRNIEYLSKIITINNLKNVTIVPCAISDHTDLFAFETGDNCALGRISDAGKQPVVAISCDAFVKKFNYLPDLMKIDVEGAEVLVLQGARKIISEHKPTILLSTHGDSLRKDCLSLLGEWGYSNVLPINADRVEAATEFLIKT